ncbi:hypothetical protein M885DRAFT_5223 [Pelagophyceae sp. CCMP2097]|nr:hypothetical protein M885DRAFT_5223 [Pelagophyceae sp. CCMP2097]
MVRFIQKKSRNRDPKRARKRARKRAQRTGLETVQRPSQRPSSRRHQRWPLQGEARGLSAVPEMAREAVLETVWKRSGKRSRRQSPEAVRRRPSTVLDSMSQRLPKRRSVAGPGGGPGDGPGGGPERAQKTVRSLSNPVCSLSRSPSRESPALLLRNHAPPEPRDPRLWSVERPMSGAEYDCKSTAGQRRGHRYRTDVFDEGLTRNDSETMGTRTSVRSGTMDLRELRGERLLMQRLGFVEHVDALDKRIAYFQELQKKEAEARHATYRDRRMRMLHAQHMRRLEDYEVELEANLEATKIECHRREEILAEQHRQQRDEFVERVIRRATNSSDISATACTCTNRYTCQHNKTARYRLRKRNPMVIKYANAARRLRKNRRMGEAMEFEEKATLIENEEKIKWTLQVQNNALQTKLPVMVETHERQSKAMLERHASLQENLALSNSRKLTNLERVLECERSKADTKMSKLKAQDFLQDASAGEVRGGGGEPLCKNQKRRSSPA